jgi:hypothetical protein
MHPVRHLLPGQMHASALLWENMLPPQCLSWFQDNFVCLF